ncbi:unnamed protein product [Bursaphelenchus okinawaensis]|uniref:Serpentine receptor class gamma n=1 Tax=Bursaphelenchus okinawaensis TaxID=465554 RepID=A0A811L6E0_9BILA|nr:unnamed protein product [Bursaphelenchus okinawaensis]CAG9117435.1 unnamed protein product [Bursaphelenchus okinawaensis]
MADRILVDWLRVDFYDLEEVMDYVKYTMVYSLVISELPVCAERVAASVFSKTYEAKKFHVSTVLFFGFQMTLGMFISTISNAMYTREHFLYYLVKPEMQAYAQGVLAFFCASILLNFIAFVIFIYLEQVNLKLYNRPIRIGETLSYRYQLNENVAINRLLLPWSISLFIYSFVIQGSFAVVLSGMVTYESSEMIHHYMTCFGVTGNCTAPLLLILFSTKMRARFFEKVKFLKCTAKVDHAKPYKAPRMESICDSQDHFNILAKAWDQ